MKSRNTYRGGLDRDTSKLKYPQDRYYYNQNFRPVTDSGESTGALENVIGNQVTVQFPTAFETIIGSTNIRDTTVLFTTLGTGPNPGGVDVDETASATAAGRIYTVDFNHILPGAVLDLLVDQELNFTSQKPIEAVGRYENEDTQKVYWTDHLNNLRFCNIADPDIGTLTPSQFDIIADVDFEKPVLTAMGGGSLVTGVVQYAYQLFNDNGAETTFSPASDFVHLTSASEGLINSEQYKGQAQLDDAGDQNISGKSVTMTISNVDTSFDQIKIVAIQYASLNGTPSINVVAIKPVASSMVFTDDGVYTQGDIPLDIYRLLSQRLFTSRTLETKDNILFTGNITDRFWNVDFDARAYRFNSGQTGAIYEADGTTLEYMMTGPSPLYPTGGATGAELDAFNIMNDVSLDEGRGTLTGTFIYQPDGARIGGSGPNVGYTFSLNNVVLDDSDALSVTGTFFTSNANSDGIGFSYSNYASPYVSGTQRGYHRGEIYRFGIILYDVKGRVSPVKWTGDIRMPDQSNQDSVTTFNDGSDNVTDFRAGFLNTSDNKVRMNILGIDFTVQNLPDTVSSYQIVRVKREPQDRTVLAQGEIFAPIVDTYMPATMYCPHGDTTTLGDFYGPDSNDVLSLIYSPEITFNKNLIAGGNDFIEAACGKDLDSAGATANYDIGTPDGNINKYRGYKPMGAAEYASRHFDVTDGQIVPVGGTATVYSINSVSYNNQSEFLYTARNSAFGGTVLAINDPDVGWMASGGAVTGPIVNYRRPTSQYGGPSFEDRSVNEYIACSDVFDEGEIGASGVYGGDTFLGYYDSQRLMWDLVRTADDESFCSAHYTVLESSINLPLRHDDCYHRVRLVENHHLIQEEAGVHTNTTDTYAQETDLYLYNSAYSQNNTSKIYAPISSDFENQTKSDALIIASGIKINGELVDSWTQFQQNEEIEVDTKYGPLSKLMNFRNHLVYFQDEGVGTVGVNQQTLVESGSLPELVLGTGEVLDRYDYITTNSGCQIREATCQSDQGFYWYDTVKNKFNRYSGQLKNISDVKGMFSYFNSRVPVSDDGRSDLFTGTQVLAVFDDKFREAIYAFKDIRSGIVTGKAGNNLTVDFREGDFNSMEDGDSVVGDGYASTAAFTPSLTGLGSIDITNPPYYDDFSVGDEIRISFPDSDYNFTLVYNELMDAFAYFATYQPTSYIKTNKRYLSVEQTLPPGEIFHNWIYEHNKGERCHFYGGYNPATVQSIVNPNEDIINVYNNVELMTEVYSNTGTNIVDETVTSVRVTNDYQDSGVIALSPNTNIQRRLRKWRFQVPRDGLARIRDAHIKMLLSYTNTSDNKRIVLHDIISHFMPREN